MDDDIHRLHKGRYVGTKTGKNHILLQLEIYHQLLHLAQEILLAIGAATNHKCFGVGNLVDDQAGGTQEFFHPFPGDNAPEQSKAQIVISQTEFGLYIFGLDVTMKLLQVQSIMDDADLFRSDA